MAILAIDFGTSNCAAYVVNQHGHLLPVLLEPDSRLLPTVIFAYRPEVEPEVITETKIQAHFDQAWKAAERNRQHFSREQLWSLVESQLKTEANREAARKYWQQTLVDIIRNGDKNTLFFGNDALEKYITNPSSGILLKSPKSFLGSNISKTQILMFEEVVTVFLAHIKHMAEEQLGETIGSVVIGRPVNYQGIAARQHAGNDQAINIMRHAARRAGFNVVEFYEEPLAAALTFQARVQASQNVLIIDIGGGTTDCAMVQVKVAGGNTVGACFDVLGTSGIRVGGTDFDEALGVRMFKPLFVPVERSDTAATLERIFYLAIATRDLPKQDEFRQAAHIMERLLEMTSSSDVAMAMIGRLQQLHKADLQHCLIQTAEKTKIDLTENNRCVADVGYLGSVASLDISLNDFAESAARHIRSIKRVIEEALNNSRQRVPGLAMPDRIFVTGGMANSRVVKENLAQAFKGTVIEYGDMFCSVAEGLGIYAAQLQYTNDKYSEDGHG